jgi:hypothetical protein
MKVGRRPSVFGKYGIREVGILLLVFAAAWLCCRVGRCSSRAPGRVVEGFSCDSKPLEERKDCIADKLADKGDLNQADCQYISESTYLCSNNEYRIQCPFECGKVLAIPYVKRFVNLFGKMILRQADATLADNACAIVTTTYDHQSDAMANDDSIPKWLVEINPGTTDLNLLLNHWNKKDVPVGDTNTAADLCVTTTMLSLDKTKKSNADCYGAAEENIYHKTKGVHISKRLLPLPLRNVMDNVDNKAIPVINIKEIDVNKIIDFLDYNFPGKIHRKTITTGKMDDERYKKSHSERGDELLFKSDDDSTYLLMQRYICGGDKLDQNDFFLDKPPNSQCVLKGWKTFCEKDKYPEDSTHDVSIAGGRICRHPNWIKAAFDQIPQYSPEDGTYEDAKAKIVDYVNYAGYESNPDDYKEPYIRQHCT